MPPLPPGMPPPPPRPGDTAPQAPFVPSSPPPPPPAPGPPPLATPWGGSLPPGGPPPPGGSFPPGSVPPSPSPRPRAGVVVAVLAVVGILAAGVGGIAIGQALDDDPVGREAVSAVPVADGTTPTVPGAADAEEPVAAVAASLGPAVVQIETQGSLGSGFVYDAEEGLVMTAAHVVDGARQVTVRLADGRAVDGTVEGTDDGSDVAVVRVEADDLVAATLALDEAVQVGQLAVAIGSPFGLDQTVTSGVVSAVGRTVETPGGAIPMIQTDAPINPGNSGGALADRQGRVIGINDSIASESGGNVGVGFAIPIETAKAIADKLVAGETITNGYLGVGAADPTDGSTGAVVQQVEPDSPAEEAGIEEGDLVTGLDGTAIDSAADLVAMVRSREPGTEVTLTVDRRGDTSEVSVTLGEAPRRTR